MLERTNAEIRTAFLEELCARLEDIVKVSPDADIRTEARIELEKARREVRELRGFGPTQH